VGPNLITDAAAAAAAAAVVDWLFLSLSKTSSQQMALRGNWEEIISCLTLAMDIRFSLGSALLTPSFSGISVPELLLYPWGTLFSQQDQYFPCWTELRLFTSLKSLVDFRLLLTKVCLLLTKTIMDIKYFIIFPLGAMIWWISRELASTNRMLQQLLVWS
jgi:hypothetical protein